MNPGCTTDGQVVRSAAAQEPITRRIAIIGTSCTGKSTLGQALGARLGQPWIEIDDLHWEPGWSSVGTEELRRRVQVAADGDRWIIVGNYSRVRELVLARATMVVWLNYSFPLTFWRCVKRTFRRVVWQEPCCNGNYETLRLTCSQDSIVLWVVRTWGKVRRQYACLLPTLEEHGIAVVVHGSPRETARWVESLPGPAA